MDMARNPLPDHSPNRRLGGLEALRGMGAFVVLLHHCGWAFLPFVCIGNPAPRHFAGEAWIHATPLALFVAGRFAVVVFFVLSAFVLSLGFLGADGKDDRDLAAATFKRVFRLAPLVAVGVLLPAMLNQLGWIASKPAAEITGSTMWLALQGGWNATMATVARIVAFNLFDQGQYFNSALWTIGLELKGSYFVYLVLFVARRTRWRWGIYAWLAIWLRADSLLAFLAGLVLADVYASVPGFRRWSDRGWVLLPVLALALLWGTGAFLNQ